MKNTDIQERVLQPAQGIPVLILELILIVVSILLMIGGVVLLSCHCSFPVGCSAPSPAFCDRVKRLSTSVTRSPGSSAFCR